jgi:hypothetical protein
MSAQSVEQLWPLSKVFALGFELLADDALDP